MRVLLGVVMVGVLALAGCAPDQPKPPLDSHGQPLQPDGDGGWIAEDTASGGVVTVNAPILKRAEAVQPGEIVLSCNDKAREMLGDRCPKER